MITEPTDQTDALLDGRELLFGVVVGIPAATGAGALMTISRSFFGTTNAALVMMLVVVAVAAVGGRGAGIVTALAAVVSFDFFHTQPYLSLTIDSRDDVETTVLLLVAGLLAGTLGARGRMASRRAQFARNEIERIHLVAEASASGRPSAEVIALAERQLGELLSLADVRFEPASSPGRFEQLDRNGGLEIHRLLRYAVAPGGREGFELPTAGVELPVLVRGEMVGRFVMIPTPGVPAARTDRLVAVVIADQVAAAWDPSGVAS
jgi:hypothetical protein